MNGAKIIIRSIICLMTVTEVMVRAEEKVDATRAELPVEKKEREKVTRHLELFPGVTMHVTKGNLEIQVRFGDLYQVIDVEKIEERKSHGDKNENPLKKIGSMVMMVPIAMQFISLPGAIASIKTSLLRSIFVAKLAILMMIYNVIRSSQDSDVTVVHQSQHNKHYYHNKHNYPSDDDEAWYWR